MPPDRTLLPWTKSCFVCGEENPNGLQLKSWREGELVVTEYTTRDVDRGWKHIVHGGIAMTLLDEVMTWAAILEAGAACVAAELTTRLRQPITVGERLRIEGQTAGGKARLILTEGRILNADGAVVATATGKYLPMPSEHISLCEKDFVTSPDALPPTEIFTR